MKKAKLEPISELPDLHLWVSEDGEQWGVGELLIVKAKKWTDEDFGLFLTTPYANRWGLAQQITTKYHKE